jgi:hypothetical protein
LPPDALDPTSSLPKAHDIADGVRTVVVQGENMTIPKKTMIFVIAIRENGHLWPQTMFGV